MSKIVVVYHSGYGHTKRIAETVAESAGAQLIAIDAEGNLKDADWEALAAADAIVFGSPTYMGAASWQFKKFADASSKPWYSQVWKDKLAAGFTNSATLNGDKFNTLTYLVTLSQQHSMFWVGSGMQAPNAKKHGRDDVNHLGGYTGLITATPSDASAEEMVPGDIATGVAFGTASLEVLGGLALAFGLKARWAAGALAFFTLLASFLFHNFWALPADQVMVNQLMFMKNLSVIGGLLMVVAFGAGPASVDARFGARRPAHA